MTTTISRNDIQLARLLFRKEGESVARDEGVKLIAGSDLEIVIQPSFGRVALRMNLSDDCAAYCQVDRKKLKELKRQLEEAEQLLRRINAGERDTKYLRHA